MRIIKKGIAVFVSSIAIFAMLSTAVFQESIAMETTEQASESEGGENTDATDTDNGGLTAQHEENVNKDGQNDGQNDDRSDDGRNDNHEYWDYWDYLEYLYHLWGWHGHHHKPADPTPADPADPAVEDVPPCDVTPGDVTEPADTEQTDYEPVEEPIEETAEESVPSSNPEPATVSQPQEYHESAPAPEPEPIIEMPVVAPAAVAAPIEELVIADEEVALAAAPVTEEMTFDISPFMGSGEVVKAMQAALTATFNDNSFEYEIYEVTLMVPGKDGTLVPATYENFPKGGKLTVVLPYPEGTNKDDYTFSVSHMFTTDFFGKTPGEIETPEVRLTGEGIEFDVTGLSPIALGWLKIFEINKEPDVIVTTITPDGEMLDIEEEEVAKAPEVSRENFWAIIASMGTLAFAALVYIIIDKRQESHT